MQFTTETTHILESQGKVLSAGYKCSSPQTPPTFLKAKDRCRQQGPNAAHHRSHSLPGEHLMSAGSRMQFATEATHFLESREYMSSAGSTIQLTTETTHFLESQGQALSALAGSKYSSPRKPLTDWRAEDRHHRQGLNTARHRSHLLSGEQRTHFVSRVQN